MAIDHAEALSWFRLAADQGHAGALQAVGLAHQEGLGTPRDYVQAEDWYRRAAEGGSASAMNNLGWMYEKGWGFPADNAEALIWYREAAAQGEGNAMANLARLLADGRVGATGLVEAYKWLEIWERRNAAAMDAGRIRASLHARMKPAEIQEAKRQAHEWRPLGVVKEPFR